MNPGVSNTPGSSVQEPYNLPSLHDQMGQAAMEYLKNKKSNEIKPDPLFTDRNTY